MFRFTIRDVLWLTALAAVVVVWWSDHYRLSQIARNDRAAAKASEERVKVALTEIEFFESMFAGGIDR